MQRLYTRPAFTTTASAEHPGFHLPPRHASGHPPPRTRPTGPAADLRKAVQVQLAAEDRDQIARRFDLPAQRKMFLHLFQVARHQACGTVAVA